MKLYGVVTAAFLVCAAASSPVHGQDPAAEKMRVFIDCSYHCDMDFLRTEITWVDYMRDRADAAVHVLVTRQTTGGGGGEYTLEFIGLRQLAGRADTLRYVASSEATGDIIRRGLARNIALGLVPFVATTPMGSNLSVVLATPDAPAAGADPAVAAEPQADPWNFWTFTVRANGNSNGETQRNSYNISGGLTANRTTEAWKVNLGLNGSYNESKFEYTIEDENVKVVSIRRSYGANALLVKSLGPHLSAGLRANASTSTFGNTSLSLSVNPAIEYNFIPYSESTRRSFIAQYSAGVRYFDYREVTIFGEIEETRPAHNLSVSYATRQPWGSVNIGVSGSQYLHDTQKYNVGIGGGFDARIIRGLSFNVYGDYRRVRDQLSLAGRDLTEEEILLQQRQLATGYSFYLSAGISYRFGSIFNSVVNPRFGGSGEGMVIMM
jgi:hypothetical protein